MHTIELNIDDSIFDKFMGLLDILPEDKLEVISDKEYPNISLAEAGKKAERTLIRASLNEIDINELLREHSLLHFKFFEDDNKIVYTHSSGSVTQARDYHKLVALLKENNIKHNDIGIDVLMIEKD